MLAYVDYGPAGNLIVLCMVVFAVLAVFTVGAYISDHMFPEDEEGEDE